MALAAAPTLCELLALDAAEVPRELFNRAALLVGRLAEEAVHRGAEAQAAVYGAAFGGGRFARYLNAEGNVIAAATRKPAAELTRADARSYACWRAMDAPFLVRGNTVNWKAVGLTAMEYIDLVRPHLSDLLLPAGMLNALLV